MDTAPVIYEYEHSSGIIERADRLDAIDLCPVLGHLAITAPDQIDIAMEMLAKGQAILAAEAPTAQNLESIEQRAAKLPERTETKPLATILVVPELHEEVLLQTYVSKTAPTVPQPQPTIKPARVPKPIIRTTDASPAKHAPVFNEIVAAVPVPSTNTRIDRRPQATSSVLPAETAVPSIDVPSTICLEPQITAISEGTEEIEIGLYSLASNAQEVPLHTALPAAVTPELVDYQPTITLETIKVAAIQEQPLIETIKQVADYITQPDDSPEQAEVITLLTEIVALLIVDTAETKEALEEKITILLNKLGYEKPAEELQKFLVYHTLQELLEVIIATIPAPIVIDSPEFLKQSALLAWQYNDTSQTHSRLGKLLLRILPQSQELYATFI